MQSPTYFHHLDYFPYEPISPIWMIIYVLSSFYFFTILNRISQSNKKHVKLDWMKHNIFLSFLHSLICSILIILSIVQSPEIFKDPLSHSNHFNYILISFSLGYFLYDFIDCLQNFPLSTYGILFHHIVVMSFLIHVLYYTRNIGYTIYGLSIEINSIFLHARRLLRWYSPLTTSDNLLKNLIDIGNYLTFILFRFGIVILGLHALYHQKNRFHPIVYIFTVLISLAVGTLNLILFYRLCKNQLSGKSKKNNNIMFN